MYTHWQKQKKTKETKNRQALKNQLYVNVGNQYKINTLTQTATQTNTSEKTPILTLTRRIASHCSLSPLSLHPDPRFSVDECVPPPSHVAENRDV